MTVEIIKANTNTIQKVTGVFDLYRQFYGQDSDFDGCADYLVQRQEADEATVFFAQNSTGEVIGFTQIYPTFSSVSLRRDLVLNDLFVLETARGQGIARKLLQAAKGHALDVGSKGILLETDIINTNAQALYESFGFERVTDHYFYYLVI